MAGKKKCLQNLDASVFPQLPSETVEIEPARPEIEKTGSKISEKDIFNTDL